MEFFDDFGRNNWEMFARKHLYPVLDVCCIAVANYPALCVQYDVGKLPVSIHLPLYRTLAGLYVALGRHAVPYSSHELYIEVCFETVVFEVLPCLWLLQRCLECRYVRRISFRRGSADAQAKIACT